ncbi:hypothetical protein T492DRAFT_973322 [Pavlovales sp. CCMP2436]|nr:hypothetical protein T492DRAFT_973322 [Pavlovales sp. CCMP2436]
MAVAPSAHTLRVCLIYRRALKTMFNWVVDRETFIAEALDMRKQFEANRHVRSEPLTESICVAAEAEILRWKHPDPYKFPWQPGGTTYMRYPNNGAGLPKSVTDIPEHMVDQYVELYYLPKVKNLPPT